MGWYGLQAELRRELRLAQVECKWCYRSSIYSSNSMMRRFIWIQRRVQARLASWCSSVLRGGFYLLSGLDIVAYQSICLIGFSILFGVYYSERLRVYTDKLYTSFLQPDERFRADFFAPSRGIDSV